MHRRLKEDKMEIKRESKFSVYLEEQLKDPEFKKEWDALQPGREAIRAEIEAQQK